MRKRDFLLPDFKLGQFRLQSMQNKVTISIDCKILSQEQFPAFAAAPPHAITAIERISNIHELFNASDC